LPEVALAIMRRRVSGAEVGIVEGKGVNSKKREGCRSSGSEARRQALILVRRVEKEVIRNVKCRDVELRS